VISNTEASCARAVIRETFPRHLNVDAKAIDGALTLDRDADRQIVAPAR
jgi:hypothetical protein